MNVNLICPIIVLENETNPDIRKNDVKKFKLLVNSNGDLVNVKVNDNITLKDMVKNNISSIIDSKVFHLEQVYALGEDKYYFDNNIDIIYLAITNIENINNLDCNYDVNKEKCRSCKRRTK